MPLEEPPLRVPEGPLHVLLEARWPSPCPALLASPVGPEGAKARGFPEPGACTGLE